MLVVMVGGRWWLEQGVGNGSWWGCFGGRWLSLGEWVAVVPGDSSWWKGVGEETVVLWLSPGLEQGGKEW